MGPPDRDAGTGLPDKCRVELEGLPSGLYSARHLTYACVLAQHVGSGSRSQNLQPQGMSA